MPLTAPTSFAFPGESCIKMEGRREGGRQGDRDGGPAPSHSCPLSRLRPLGAVPIYGGAPDASDFAPGGSASYIDLR